MSAERRIGVDFQMIFNYPRRQNAAAVSATAKSPRGVFFVQKTAIFEILTSEQKRFADVNGDTSINVKDATAIQKYAAMIDTGFGVGERL